MPSKKTIPTMQPVVQSTAVDYQKLFESLPNGYIAFLPNDPLFTIAAENRAHAKLALQGSKDITGKPLLEVFPDTSKQYKKTGVSDLIESLRRVIKTKRPDTMATLRYDLKALDGTMVTKYWRVTHYPVVDSRNKLDLIYQATEDITDEIITETKLATTKQQLDEALSIGMIGTWLWDVGRDIVIGDSNMAVMFGVSPREAAEGLPLARFMKGIHPNDRARVREQITAVLSSGGLFQSEYRTIGQDGLVRWLIARGRIEYDKSGHVTQFPGVLVDISERKLVENNLRFLAQASAALSASLNYTQTLQTIAKLMVPDIADWCGIDMLDDHHQLQQVAVAHKDPKKVKWAIELRKKQGPPSLDDPTGLAQVIRSGTTEYYPEISEELLEASTSSPEELQLVRDLALSSIIIVPLKIEDQTVGGISLIITDKKRYYTQSDLEMAEELGRRASLAMTNARLFDNAQHEITERIRLEKALKQANEELESRVEQRTAELESTNLSLQRSNQELQDFAYVASHDLQEPLRKIQAFGNLLETEYADSLGDGKDYLERMRNAAKRMSALIEDILSFSRVTTKGRSFTPVNLRTVAAEVIGDLEIRIADTAAMVEIGSLPTIPADAMQMRQLLQNLITNAIKFHRDDVRPIIKLQARIEQGFCHLEVIDNGLGFDEKYLDRIFAVFQRLHDRKTYEGTGIGLAVCRKIVERHGGTITATSRLGKGSTFIISLPMRHKKGESLL